MKLRAKATATRGAALPALALWLALVTVLAPSVFAHADVHERIAAVDQQIQREPNNAKLYLKRGELHRLHRDWDAALADYHRAAELEPGSGEVLFLRGRMLLEAGQPEKAKRELDQFLESQPDHREALLTRARALASLGEGASAARDYTRVIASLTQPTPEYYLERAKALEASGQAYIEEALGGLDQGIAKLGPLVTLQLYAIDLEVKREHFDAALDRLDVIAPWLRPERHLQRRGEVLLRAGKPDEARTSLSEALALLESHPQSRRRTSSSRTLEAHLRSIIHELPLDQSPLGPKK